MIKSQQMPGLFSGPPARRIGPGYRGMRGTVYLLGEDVAHESALERDFLLQMTLDRTLTAIKAQPVTIRYDGPQRKGRYTPDYATEHNGPSGEKFLIEVKFREDLINEWSTLKPRLMAARRFARENGMKHIILTEVEIRTPALKNADLLVPYRAVPKDDCIERHLIYKLAGLGGEATPRELLAAAYAADANRQEALNYLIKLVGEGTICADLEAPLSMSMPIWLDKDQDWRGNSNPYSWRPIKLRLQKALAAGLDASASSDEDNP